MSVKDIQTLYRHDLCSFTRCSFGILHPHVEYRHNWHIDVITDHLTKVSNGEINRLIINAPPRSLKSLCASIAFPAWVLGRDPRKKILCLHSGNPLGRELDELCYRLMTSSRYRSLFPSTIVNSDKNMIKTAFGGRRQFMPIMNSMTGVSADLVIIDDPISTLHARNAHERERLQNQFDDNILQRLNDKEDGAIILVTQRTYEDDLTQHLLQKGGWTHLSLSAIAMKDEEWELPYGKRASREKTEALHPERESEEQLLDILDTIGGHAFSYQYLQGEYKPRFGDAGHGCIWVTPHREGIPLDLERDRHGPLGFIHYKEQDLIWPRVFGIGEDPAPPDMGRALTEEEFELLYGKMTYSANLEEDLTTEEILEELNQGYRR